MINLIKSPNINFKGSANFYGGSNFSNEKSGEIQFRDIQNIFESRDRARREMDRKRRANVNVRYSSTGDSFESEIKRSPRPSKKKSNVRRMRAKRRRKKMVIRAVPIIMAGSTVLGAFGIFAVKNNNDGQKTAIEINQPVQIAQINNQPEFIEEHDITTRDVYPTAGFSKDSELDTIKPTVKKHDSTKKSDAKRKAEVKEAIEVIKSKDYLKESYYNILTTIKNMEKSLGCDPIEIINDYVKQDWGNKVNVELVLSQIFVESGGNHYLSDGSVNESYAFCRGFMQLSSETTSDLNKKYFKGKKLDRDDPFENLKLGIGYDNYLLNLYGEEMFTKMLTAYNAGPGASGKGAEMGREYAAKILDIYKVLKHNPEYTKMLFNGEFDKYEKELL